MHHNASQGDIEMIGRNKVQQLIEAPTLQYASGKSVARHTIGSGRFSPLVGFHIEVGKDAELDEAMRAAKVAQIEIKHQRQGGAEIVRHWFLGESVRLYPVTSGPVAPTVAGSLAGRNAAATAEAGIGLRWGANERSKMAVRGYLDIDGDKPLVQLSVRSRMTDVLLGALLDHERVLEAADSLIDRAKHPAVVTYHEIALPLGPADEQEWGKGDTATVVPFKSLHPAEVGADYLRTVWRPDGVHSAAEQAWAATQAWAAEYAAQTDDQDRTPPPAEEAAPATFGPTTGELAGMPPPSRQTADEAMASGQGRRRR
jgi:hypothetical protein